MTNSAADDVTKSNANSQDSLGWVPGSLECW